MSDLRSATDRNRARAQLTGELIDLLRADIRARTDDDDARRPKDALQNGGLEGSSKRDNARHASPVLHVHIGAQGYRSIDWSLGGVQIGGYVGTVKLASRLRIVVADGTPNGTLHPIDCRVSRVDRKRRSLSLRFDNPSGAMVAWLAGLRPRST
ncbi:MAG: hypothetical protein JO021_11720 [Alphaproteobacteria bacterium]|nr:hypothetical protein [Alphaproteobacteria bacterium]